jgi:hypothetical protein
MVSIEASETEEDMRRADRAGLQEGRMEEGEEVGQDRKWKLESRGRKRRAVTRCAALMVAPGPR